MSENNNIPTPIPPKLKEGRPTLYNSQVIEQINEYLRDAIPEKKKIPTVEGIALRLGISRDTLYEWAKEHPRFSDTLGRLKMRQKELLTEIGIFGGKEINGNIVSLLLKVNHGMIETLHTDLTSGGKPILGGITSTLVNTDK